MQLLIIDVQNTYRSHCQHLLDKIPPFAANFSEVLYLFDNINGQELYEELPEEWQEESEPFSERLSTFTKNYAFFRGLMDQGIAEEEIIQLGKFLLNHKLIDAREIIQAPSLRLKFQQEFKNSVLSSYNFEDHTFYLPEDLLNELRARVRPGIVLIGGGRRECLAEVSLVLQILDLEHTICEELTY